MLNVSSEYLKAIVGDVREMPYRVTIDGDVVLTQDDIPNMTLEESVSGSSGLSLGTSNAAELTLTIRNPSLTSYDGLMVEPYSGLVMPNGTTYWLPLGKFWVAKTSTSDDYKTVKLTCYDGMHKLSSEYISDMTYPADLQSIMHEVVQRTGLYVDLNSIPNITVHEKPSGMTYRALIGHVAGCMGCNARFDRYGNLEFVWYTDTGLTIEREAQYMNGMMRLHDKPLEVDFEVTGKKETYHVDVNVDGLADRCSVTVSPDVIYEGDTVTVTVNCDEGYNVHSWSVPPGATYDVSKPGRFVLTFVQPEKNVAFDVSICSDAEYNLSLLSNLNNCFISTIWGSDKITSRAGIKTFIDVSAAAGYEISSFTTTPEGIEVYKSDTPWRGDYYFYMPESDATITANFRRADLTTYPLYTTLRCVEECSKTPGSVTIRNATTGDRVHRAGDTVIITPVPENGHTVVSCVGNVDLVKQDDGVSYAFVMPPQEAYVTIEFGHEPVMYSVRRNAVVTDKVTMTYTNPLIYSKAVPVISELVQGITYMPAKVKYRGNPALQAGDIVTVPDRDGVYHTVLIMQQTMTFGGGMNAEIRCPGETEAYQSYSNVSPVTTQVKQEMSQYSSDLARKVAANAAAINELRSSMILRTDSIGKRVTDVEVDIVKLDSRLKVAETSLTELAGRMDTLEGEFTYIEEDVAAIQAAVTELEKVVAANEEAIGDLDYNFAYLFTLVSDLESDVDFAHTRLDGLESRLTILEDNTTLGNLKRQLAATDQQIAHCAEVFMLEVMVNGTAITAVVLPYNISELHTTRETLRAQIAELEATNNG